MFISSHIIKSYLSMADFRLLILQMRKSKHKGNKRFGQQFCIRVLLRNRTKRIDVCVGVYIYIYLGFPDGSVVKNPPANAGDAGLIPGLGRSPGEENGNPL